MILYSKEDIERFLRYSNTSSSTTDKDFIGHRSSVEFFPVYSLWHTFSNHSDRNFYYKPKVARYRVYQEKIDYKTILTNLSLHAYYPQFFHRFKSEESEHDLYSMLGYLSDDDYNLMLLTTKSEDIFNPNGGIYAQHLRLYVSFEFMTDIIYKNVYAKIYKEYIQECFNQGIEVVYTTSEKIDKYAFANPFVKRFEDIPSLMENFNEEGFNLLTFGLEEPDNSENQTSSQGHYSV